MAETFTPLHRRCVMLTEAVSEVGDCLALSSASTALLCGELSATDSFTRFIADLPTGTVQVAFECVNDELKVIEILPVGASIPALTEIYFDWTAENWRDLQCAADALAEDEGGDGDDDDDETDPCDPVTWESCGRMYTFKDGKVTSEPLENNPNAEGVTFDPAAVTIMDGKPVFKQATCAPIQNASCDSCLTKQTGN